MRIITPEDIRDVYLKIAQRGHLFILSKFSFDGKHRTKSSFNASSIDGSNWWNIPLIKERWNYLITGDKNRDYETYVSDKFSSRKAIRFLSVGSGVCSHELKFARLNPGWDITCIDFSEKLLQKASKIAKEEEITNIHFVAEDIYEYDLPDKHYDIVLFHSSLHHFKNINEFIKRVHNSLKKSGCLIVNEFVGPNRLQYPKWQRKEINQCLSLIDKPYRKLYKTNLYKKRYYGSGILRMILADPSECIESEQILPVIRKNFKVLEEKGYGGNLLMPVLKDISHHFIDLNNRKRETMERIFEYEDDFLVNNQSDFVFGIYEKV
ncbi:MAG: class I SAM-dependent methyltransferase [Prolixibacteraceae bacterium]|nr:class I SAM-dependent methyltransferase [Prolixibacteraceae bacterium]